MRLLLPLLLWSCSTGGSDDPQVATTVDVDASSFRCITEMSPLRSFYVDNLLGDLDATLAMADAPQGTPWPVGSLVQLIPAEAMVKREAGFNEATHDWEFFSLQVDETGTTITQRGAEDVENAVGGSCFGCHQGAVDWDLICEKDHGCVALNVTPEVIVALQEGDRRCD